MAQQRADAAAVPVLFALLDKKLEKENGVFIELVLTRSQKILVITLVLNCARFGLQITLWGKDILQV